MWKTVHKILSILLALSILAGTMTVSVLALDTLEENMDEQTNPEPVTSASTQPEPASSTTPISSALPLAEMSELYPTVKAESLVVSGSFKTEYFIGEAFDNNGIVVTAIYSDGSTNDVSSEVDYTGYDSEKAGEQTVIVTYSEGENVVSSAFVVIVQEQEEDISGQSGDLSWIITGDGTLTISGNGVMLDYSSSSPAPWIEYKDSITKIIIETGVQNIGTYAFYRNTKNYLSLVTEVTIPDTIASIGKYAFHKMTALSTVWYGGSPNSWEALKDNIGNNNAPLLNAENIIYAKENSPIVEIIVGGTYRKEYAIGEDFDSTGLVVLAIAEDGSSMNVTKKTSIDTSGFDSSKPGECTLTAIYDDGNEQYMASFVVSVKSDEEVRASGTFGATGDNLTWSLTFGGDMTISGAGGMNTWAAASETPWYEYRNSIKSVIVDTDVTNVGNYAFAEYPKLESVMLSSSVNRVGTYAFRMDSALTTINLENVITVQDNAFIQSGITEAVLDKATSIGANAFSQCVNLESVTIREPVIGENAFNGCQKLTNVDLRSVKIIGDRAFVQTSIGGADLSSATSVGSEAFASLKTLKYVVIGSELRSLTLSGTGITELTIPGTLTEFLFSYNTDLESIIIEEGITGIPEYSLSNNTKLKTVVLPTSLTSIDATGFYNCTALETINFSGTRAAWEAIGYNPADGVTVICSDDPVIVASGECGDQGDNITWTLTADGILTLIGTGATESYSSRSSFKIAYAQDIGDTVITSVVIGADITEIGQNFFAGMDTLTSAQIEGGDWSVLTIQNGNDPLTALIPQAPELSASVVAVNLSLTGNIGLNFFLIPNEALLDDDNAYVQFSFKNAAQTPIPISAAVQEQQENGEIWYKFTQLMAAKEMTEFVTLRIYDGNGNQIKLFNSKGVEMQDDKVAYSVAAYAGSNQLSEETKALAQAMTTYGAYAMNYFSYTPVYQDDANAGNVVMNAVSGSASELIEYKATRSGTMPDGLSIPSIFLTLETETAINVELSVAEGHEIGDYTFTMEDGKTLTPTASGSNYILVIPNISAKKLDSLYTINIGNCEVGFSALSYAYSILKAYENNSDKVDVCNLVRALYAYNQAANTYFNAN